MTFQLRLGTYLSLGLLLLFCVYGTDARRKSRYRKYQNDQPAVTGPHSCGSGAQRRCCGGWTLPPGGRRCVLPICSGGCGGGRCMRPGLCLCVTGQIQAYCGRSGASASGNGINGNNGNGGNNGVNGGRVYPSQCNPACKNGGVCVGRNLCRCPSGFSGGTCDNDQPVQFAQSGRGECVRTCPNTVILEELSVSLLDRHLRTGPCYTQLSDNMCRGQLPGVSCTKHLCCSTIGMAWGDPCEECPAHPHPCRRGYIPNLEKNTCQDIDECSAIPGLCVSGKCINTVGSYVCECQKGQRQNQATGVCEDINECLLDFDICGNGQCVNTVGSYFCTCDPGYEPTADRSTCIKLQKKSCYTQVTLHGRCANALSQLISFDDCCCKVGKGWGDDELCQLCPEKNTEAYRRQCESPERYRRDECELFPNLCKNGRCVNTDYSYRCECYDGYSNLETGNECIDIDECSVQSGLCLNGDCINLPGSFECKCNEGFILAANGRYCTDMNECEKTNMCPNGKCVNMDGSYKCQCNRGYKQSANQQICLDINECTENGRLCIHGQCLNTPGSYRCVCDQGYTLSPDGAYCLDYNECANTGMCTNGMCRNMAGSYKCLCSPGYTLASSGDACIDINECDSQPGICKNGQCINNQGSFKCECPLGFTLGPDSRTCLDTRKDLCYMTYRRGQCSNPSRILATKSQCCCMVDSMEASGIAWGAMCEPCPSMSDPKYKEICPNGQYVDFNGGPINQCAMRPDICEHGDCERTRAGYRCICHAGFETDPSRKRCIDKNECAANTRLCDGGQCKNTEGSYQCICPLGSRFNVDNKMCEDIDECTSSPCIGGTCINEVGSFRCICEPGFSLDNARRICLDERLGPCWMEIRNGECEANVRQRMLKSQCCGTIGKGWGSPCESCETVNQKCQKGFQYRGDQCIDIDECSLFANLCKGGGTCINNEGSYTCQCPPGMQLDSAGTNCVDLRTSTCFYEYSRGVCRRALEDVYTRAKCCCSVGQAWSPQCEPCPREGTDEFNILCPGGKGRVPDTDFPVDINECREIPGICVNGQCRNTPGSFTCTCEPGYAGDSRGINCTDIDECSISFGICANGRCVNTPGAFRCECEDGFLPVMMDQMCMDIDECKADLSLCRGGTCINEQGGFRCICPDGLNLSDDGRECLDEDECSASSSICSNGFCENFMGGYQCTCDVGFTQNSQKTACLDVNECADQRKMCEYICVNTPGSYSCGCEEGFSLMPDGRSCRDVDECKENPNVCNGGKCLNTPGGYRCTCVGGLRPSDDLKQCLDVDECTESFGLCGSGFCENNHGSFTCICDIGYWIEEGSRPLKCTDIDECKTGENQCDKSANCINTQGSYKCSCENGYEGDGYICRDVNECLQDGMCSPDAECMNKPGSYSCVCLDGFIGDGFTCRDVDECRMNQLLCENGQCLNFQGGYRCVCDMGFSPTENERSCVDINECILSKVCVNGECENRPGDFTCNCKPGYELDDYGGNCTDINECDFPDKCMYGNCSNYIGGYTCTCPPNYELNPSGTGCIDTRTGNCFLDVSQQRRTGRCDQPLSNEMTRATCCCSIGKGWGESQDFCELCPRNDSLAYGRLCPAGPGFETNPDTLIPQDIDECRKYPNLCKNGDCQNTFGSYVCVCPNGYSLDPDTMECVDIDECKQYPGYCDPGTCENSEGSFSCKCPNGYMPMLGEGCMDMRKDICYAALFNATRPNLPPRCEHELSTQVTKRQCCCLGFVGQGWGTPCEHCPTKNSREYLELCKPLPLSESTNECDVYQFLCENGRCIDTNTEEGFLCECIHGFQYNNVSKRCEDIDECRRSPCHTNSICINTVGSYRCECIPGYDLSRNGRRCRDINECATIDGICSNGDCINLEGSYSCRCKDGYKLSSSRDACLDINECERSPGMCRNGTCENKIGGYECHCAAGFRRSVNEDCEDINECADFRLCMNGRCVNSQGSFFCTCLPGYTLSSDRMNCRDVDECSEISGTCGNGMCTNNDGSYVCTCFDGYRLSGTGDRCRDINECRTIPNICSGGRCINEDGSFKCECPPGFVLSMDGRSCIDLRQGNCFRAFERGLCRDPRPVNMTRSQCCCTSGAAWSYAGSDICEVCPIKGEAGFNDLCADDGRQIGSSGDEDLNECMLEPKLCENGRCINTDGSFRCECNPGYVLDNTRSICVDDNECAELDACNGGNCTNNVGGFHCDCLNGYAPGPQEVCEDVDECQSGLHDCKFRCLNTKGSFRCICPMGFKLAADGKHCEDVDECLTPVNKCRYACKNLIGTFICICPDGYTETGRDQCTDIDECRQQPGICGQGYCVNLPGGFRCNCPVGFQTSADGKRCHDRREDYCYRELVGRRCIPTVTTPRATEAECCCTGAVAWGRRCKNCPIPGTALYKSMCTMGSGYDLTGKDIDECSKFPNLCPNGRCLNSMGSYRCVCDRGYRANGDSTECEDLDECTAGLNSCEHECQNTEGSFKCTCRTGYVLHMDGKSCKDVDECRTGQHNCPHECVNTEGSFECGCSEGFRRGPNNQCIDVDECSEESHLCTPGGTCKNIRGGYRCVCNRGYKLTDNGTRCTDVDECEDGQCANLCENSDGSFLCGCPEGFTESWGQCLLIDVCFDNPCLFDCQPAGQAFTCGCPPGYQMMGQGHCVQTISPADYSSMFPEGEELPHETGLGTGQLPNGEGCYSCNIGDKPLDVPLSKRNKRSVEAFLNRIVTTDEADEWRNDNTLTGPKTDYHALLKREGAVELTDIKHNSPRFKPKVLRVVKREARRGKANGPRRHKKKHARRTKQNAIKEPPQADSIPVVLRLSDIRRQTKIVKIIPALSTLKGNVNYKITNRKDRQFFIKERNGVSSLHAKRKKLHPDMSYHIDIEGIPIHNNTSLSGHSVHLEKSLFKFYVYVL